MIKIITDSVFIQFIKWFDQLYFQAPNAQSAWVQSRMEYEFSVNIPQVINQKASLSSPDYVGGRLDWTSFDLHEELPPTPISNMPLPVSGEQKSDVFLPSIVTFKGMPHPDICRAPAASCSLPARQSEIAASHLPTASAWLRKSLPEFYRLFFRRSRFTYRLGTSKIPDTWRSRAGSASRTR